MTTKTTANANVLKPIERGEIVIVRGGVYHGFTVTFDHRVLVNGQVTGYVVIMDGLVRTVPRVRRPGKW